MKKITIGLAIIGILAISSSLYMFFKGSPIGSGVQYIKVPEIRTVTQIQRVEIPIKEVITIEKEKIVEKLKLPDWVKNDKNEQVIATGEIAPYEGITNAITVLNVQNGASQVIAKQMPLPLFSFESKKEVGLRYGYNADDVKTQVTLFGRWQFLRVGNFHAGLYGEVNTNEASKAVAQFEITYRW
jgi:hypothetical protein